jgi:signal-transduction protein with cAMP-binding, CBS, and nucleotidyltransferase domain
MRRVILGAAGNRRFLGRLAAAALRRRPASRLLGYQHGPHRARVDLKARGTAPIVDLAAAFDDLQQLRLGHQAARLTAGAPADDVVTIGELSALQRRRLRDAMHLVHVCQESLRIAYRTDLIA